MSGILGGEGEHRLLMGNEAIARGALEAGVGLAIGYPGTPSSEVIQTLSRVADQISMRVEWAVNEKVAVDIATGYAYAGLRALATMKNAGLNVASDTLMSVAYSDVKGGLVIYVADDPGAHAGMEEQDNRWFTRLSLLPMIDVSDPQEAKDAIVLAFELSEEYAIPMLVRSTTRVAHMTSIVELGPVRELRRTPGFERDIRRYTRASPKWCMEQHERLNEKLKLLSGRVDGLPVNRLHIPEDGAERGVVASGISWSYLRELLDRHGLWDRVAALKIGTVNPLPRGLIERLMEGVGEILVLEELEPYLELHLRAVASELDLRPIIHGKMDGWLPRVGEYTPELVERALGRLLGLELERSNREVEEARAEALKQAPRRPLPLCPGCPHRGTYTAMRMALRELGYKDGEFIVTGDIGCTILGMHPPFNLCWTEVSMGASIGLGIGLRYAGIDKPIIAAIGDSTLFHAGLPPALNSAWHRSRIVIAVLDNRVTAMTGHQPSPTSGYTATGGEAKVIEADEVLRALGIEHIWVADPYNLEEAKEAFKEALRCEGPSAVVLKRVCALVARRMGLTEQPYRVDPERCTGCQLCLRTLACPAMTLSPEGKAEIDGEACTGCGLCAQICPVGAIGRSEP